MPALFRSYNTRRTLICMSAAALLWGSSPAMSTPAHAARYHKLPELTSSGPVAADSKEAAAAARKGLYEQMSAATGIPWFRFAAIDQYERSVAKKKKPCGVRNRPCSSSRPAHRYLHPCTRMVRTPEP